MDDGDRWTTLTTRVLAPNPGPMTLDGTNSFLIRARQGDATVVVDPGPDHAAHVESLYETGDVELILLTHHHRDHTESAARLSELTGAPVRAHDPRLCIDGPPLTDRETILAGGTRIGVVFTPGHTADSVSLHLPDDTTLTGRPRTGSMITGDTILGRGTTIIAHPDGSLASYLRSLDRLGAYGEIAVLPAHGPMLPGLADVCRSYAEHRRARLGQIVATLSDLGLESSGDPGVVAAVVDAVYSDVDPAVRFAAEASVRAQLEYLAAGGLI